MFRYHILILLMLASLSGCAWSYQAVVDEPLPLVHVKEDTTPPLLSNISISRTLPMKAVAIDETASNKDSQFPDANASDTDWNAFWEKRFPQTDVFTRKPTMTDDWFFSWDRFYRSPQNRPVETMQLGNANSNVLVLGSLHGNETVAMDIAEKLARYVGNKPVVWNATSVLVVRNPNPDGTAKIIFTNNRGVDINRNFPSKDFVASNNHRTGHRGGSEVETQIICRMIADFAPRRIIHIKTSKEHHGWVIYNKRGKSTALMMGDPDSLRPKELESLQLSGSLESYATDHKLEMITLIIPRHMSKETAWRIYREPLLTALTYLQQHQSEDAFEGTRGLNEQSRLQITPRISQKPVKKNSGLRGIFNRFGSINNRQENH